MKTGTIDGGTINYNSNNTLSNGGSELDDS